MEKVLFIGEAVISAVTRVFRFVSFGDGDGRFPSLATSFVGL